MNTDSPRLRLSIVAVVVFSLFGALFARLWYLQVMVAGQYQVQASANRARTIAEEAPRGRILDVKGRVLVDNRVSPTVTLDPYALSKMKKADQEDLKLRVAQKLTEAGIPTKVSGIDKSLADKQYALLQPIPIAIDVPEDLFVYFAERAADYPGVAVERESVRQYHYSSSGVAKVLGAHLLGYVGRVNSDELAAKKSDPVVSTKPYQTDSSIGKSGVEKQYEDDLRGTPGVQTIEVDSKQTPIRVVGEQLPKPGNDLVLSVDIDVQKSAEDALATQMGSLKGGSEPNNPFPTNAPSGSVVTLDPTNGNVVAMASYPTYDPTEFVNGISTDRYNQLKGDDPAKDPFLNKAIQGQYAPGSTFKLITATSALQNGLVTANTSYNDLGSYHLQGCKASSTGSDCLKTNSGHAVNNSTVMPKALTVSSDVFFYWLGDRFWKEGPQSGIQDTARSYGLGADTGVPLPFEQNGFIPDAASLKAKFPKADPYGEGDNVNSAIGQGYVLVTPLQLANAYATFANGGTLYQPNMVTKVLRGGGKPDNPADVIEAIAPVVKGQVSLPGNVRDPILQGLEGVVRPPGTAAGAFGGFDLNAFPLAGKTGTAQVNGKADTSIFAAFGPVGAPRYATVAVLEQAGFGAAAAAPVVRHVFETVSGQTPQNLGVAAAGQAN
jgi:penicillin-binding protein 2